MSYQGARAILLFATLSLFYVIGSLVFTKGFLLKRVVVDKNSSCHVDFAEYSAEASHGKAGCWLHRRFDKAIIVIIDALRFDFMTPIRESPVSVPFLNKLPTIHYLLDSQSMNARLYKFMADPPTTTLQRLKGLTTGSLPTFVDAGSNFASSEITEDNFIDQLIQKGKKLTFMGDDTWISLFPGRFKHEFPFPSFNVKDLHTVDDGVIEHLFKEIRSKDWDVIIAHFLGVDHCGHTYGPNNPAMTSKLSQMDQVIRNVTSLLDEDAILFVMGDHGMTATGDHGGDSYDELSAGLFVYSPSQITSSKYMKDVYKTVAQTDFVPTISLLLGIPIPFSNLGTVMTDLFNYCSWSKDSHIKEVYHTVEALRLNAMQMSKFLEAYMEISSDLSQYRYTILQEDLKKTEQQLSSLVTDLFIHGHADNAHEKLHHLQEKYLQYTQEAREMCKDVWAKFDLSSIFLGIFVIIVSLAINMFVLKSSTFLSTSGGGISVCICMALAFVFILYSGAQTFYIEGKITIMMAYVLGLIDVMAVIIIVRKIKVNPEKSSIEEEKDKVKFSYVSLLQVFAIIALAASFLSFLSNSYVVYEDRIAMYFAQTLIWLFAVCCIQQILTERQSKERKSKVSNTSYDIMKTFTQPAMMVLYLTVICSTSLRTSANFRACREEQINCTISSFLQPLSSLGKTVEGSKNIRYFVSAACLVVLVYMFRKWLSHYGNLNGNSMPVTCAKYLLPASVICCIFYWAVQGLPETIINSLSVMQQTLFAQLVYAVVILSLIAVIIFPLLIFKMPQYSDNLPVPSSSESDFLIQKVYTYVKLNWNSLSTDSRMKDKPPLVYGLGTVYTSAIVYIGSIMYILTALLLGDGLSPSLLMSVVAVFTFLELYTVAVKLTGRGTDLVGPAVVTVSLLSTHFFYATGHQATIPSIRFEAAFTGFHGNWNVQVVPAMLIYLNTYAAEVLFTWMLPLLIFWPSVKGLFSQYIFKAKDDEAMTKGDFVFFENPDLLMERLIALLSTAYLCHAVKLFGAMLAAFLHRRHLFVWKIFAPRFVFQSLSSFTVFGISLLSVMFIMRVTFALQKWVKNLNEKTE